MKQPSLFISSYGKGFSYNVNNIGFCRFSSMTQIAIDNQTLGFLGCQSPPITEQELRECFEKLPIDTSQSQADKVLSLIGKTAADRLLNIVFRYVSWTGEIEILGAQDAKDIDSGTDRP